MRARIVEVVKSHRQELGEPYAKRLVRLRAYLLRTRVVRRISKERLRAILIEEGGTTQSTNGWKTSPDPRLRRQGGSPSGGSTGRPSEGGLGGVLVCFDEHGPVTPTPKAGRDWFARPRRPAGARDRRRAQATGPQGRGSRRAVPLHQRRGG